MSAMGQAKERDDLCPDGKQRLPWEREKREVAQYHVLPQLRQAGGLPFLPAVSGVMQSGLLSCIHPPTLRHLPLRALGLGVRGVDP